MESCNSNGTAVASAQSGWKHTVTDELRRRLSHYEASSQHLPSGVTAANLLLAAKKNAGSITSKASTPASPGASNMPACKVSDFKWIRIIGAGSFGRVWMARHIATDQVVAIKMMSKAAVIRENQVQHVMDEREMLLRVSGHPFLVNCRGSFQDKDHLYLVMDLVPGGEFFSYLRDNGRIREEAHARFYVAQIVLALESLHSKGIAYRDLKPENLLLGGDGYIKLTDLGFAKVVKRCTYTMCGTPDYLAPEVIQGKGHTTAVDWWSLGCVVQELICGFPPFYTGQPLETYKRILALNYSIPPDLTPWVRDLITRFLQPDPSQRLGNTPRGVQEIKEHAWFKGLDWSILEQRKYMAPYTPKVNPDDAGALFDKYDNLAPLESAQKLTDQMQAWFTSFSNS